MFVDIIMIADLEWLATDDDQQSYQRLSQTSEHVRFGRWRTFWAYYVRGRPHRSEGRGFQEFIICVIWGREGCLCWSYITL